MSLEAIKRISAAEAAAEQAKAEAAARCKQQIAAAEAAAQETIAQARRNAAAEAEKVRQDEEEKLSAQLQGIADSTKNKKATIRARAEKRMDEAAAMIAGRIVNI